MKKLLLAGLAFAALIAGPAMAADLARPVDRAVAVAAPFSWTGCYIGGNVAWIKDNSYFDLSMAGAFLNPANFFSNPANSALLNNSYTSNSSSVAGGVQVGCNYQLAPSFVIGIEGDFNGSSLREPTNSSYDPAGPFVGGPPGALASSHTEVVTKNLDWFSTLRGRAGFTWDRLFFYGTGGWVIARVSSTTNVAFGSDQVLLSGFNFVGAVSGPRSGWTVGAGAEWAVVNSWAIKLEWLHIDVGSVSYIDACAVPACAGGFAWATNNVRFRDDLIRIGLNYKFE
jgi:outer membrane immunogenic protein